MKIRTWLSLLFTFITAAILLLFAVLIWWTAASDRESAYYVRLGKEALTKANVLFDAGVDAHALQTIYRQNREILSEVEVAIYDPDFNLIYHDAEDLDFVQETPEMIHEILDRGEIRFTQNGWQVIGLRFDFEGQAYAVTAAAFDEHGHAKLNRLRNSLLLGWLAGIWVIWVAGKFFSRRALRPVSRMAEKAGEISATSLDLRLPEGKGRDELAELATTFNRLLDRLENSFDSQKHFVHHISHELRTPLAAIIGEVEIALSRERNTKAYEQALKHVLQDAHKLSRLSGGLLDLARASYDPTSFRTATLRLDEVLLDARQEVLRAHPGYRVDLHVDEHLEDAANVSMRGNAYLLKVAFINLLENGCKFSSEHAVHVRMGQKDRAIELQFTDRGSGIEKDEIGEVFTPFYRGKNAAQLEGSGIGLPLTHKIVELHKGSIDIQSEAGKGTNITLILPTDPKHAVASS